MTQITIPTFDEVADIIRQGATQVGESFREIDAEWVPIMVLQSASGALSPPFDLTPAFSSLRAKGRFLAMLPDLIWDMDARMIVLCFSAWMTVISPNADGSMPDAMDRPMPSEDPMREEKVFVMAAEVGRIESWSAQIIRTQVGPRLGAWWGVEASNLGAIPEALQEAFA